MSKAVPPTIQRRWGLFLAIAFTVVAADQVTKYLAVGHLTAAFDRAGATTFPEKVHAFLFTKHPPRGGRHVVFESWWQHLYAENNGAAFSLGARLPDGFRRGFFIVVTLVALVALGLYHHRLDGTQPWNRVALALIAGGAVGNLIDRSVRGYVVDFIDWHLDDVGWMQPNLHWATFNVADAAIVAGVVMVLLDGFRQPANVDGSAGAAPKQRTGPTAASQA